MQRLGSQPSNYDLEKEFDYDELKVKKKSRFNSKQLLNKIIHNKGYIIAIGLLCVLMFTINLIYSNIRKTGNNVVIILAVNEGGGVERWKTPEEWSIERSSIANKKDYAEKHGYTLALKDIKMQKRYSHEWREGWQKAEIIKQTMREYPQAEWFWWLDTHTYIMEPELKLEDYILKHVDNYSYKTLKYFNPLNLKVNLPYVNNKNTPINMVISQDCGGFSLGSFFIKRSEWTELLLDIWWDPALYEQMHMFWEHKEQDCLEFLYNNQPWVRESLGFVPIKAINAFPEGACWEQRQDRRYFYSNKDRDFVVNLAGCNTGGRSCWSEYQKFQKLRGKLHDPWYKFW